MADTTSALTGSLASELGAFGIEVFDPADDGTERAEAPDEGLESAEAPADVELDLEIGEDYVLYRAPGESGLESGPESGLESFPAGPQPEVHRFRFRDLPGNQIHEALAHVDRRLTPARGLRDALTGAPVAGQLSGRTLLIVHGTFSHGEAVVESLFAEGRQRGDLGRYDHIVTYDYATLSQEAVASALTLARLSRQHLPAEVDVVSHSQGGLVVRYWLERLEPERLATTRAVFVAGTLCGTSLASPAAIRSALEYLNNVAWVLRQGSQAASLAVPFFSGLSLVFGALEKTAGLLSSTPTVDAGVALIPGFSGMSRAGTNPSLRELQEGGLREAPSAYFAITGDFEPERVGWRFWRKWKERVANRLVDGLFTGAHDLVVDTDAQTRLTDAGARIEGDGRVLAFGPADGIHHISYFEHERTWDFLAKVLKRP